MIEENGEIEKIKIRIEDLEKNSEENINRAIKKRNKLHDKIITYGLGSMIGSLAFLPAAAIIDNFGITVQSSILGIIICAIYGLVIASCAKNSPL